MEKRLSMFADRFICEPSSTAQESTAGGLAIITGKSESLVKHARLGSDYIRTSNCVFFALHAAFLTELCSIELLTSTNHKANQEDQMKVVYKCCSIGA